jgi:HNH endonuclease/AP2 domain
MCELPVINGCCTIPLTRGQNVLVSSADWRRFSVHRWCVCVDGYAGRKKWAWGKSSGTSVLLHREVAMASLGSIPAKHVVDHINRDTFDCRRENIRFVTRTGNRANSAKTLKPTTSRYKGVYRHQIARKWVAQIKIQGRSHYLGLHASEKSAAKAYNSAALKLFGPTAKLNDISEKRTG